MKINLLYIIYILTILNCTSKEDANSLKGEYKGYWAETEWTFKFHQSKEFEFTCYGHYGTVNSKGSYRRVNDSLFLNPIDSSLSKDGVVNSLYLIDGDSCIIDYRLKYDYCKTGKTFQTSRVRTTR